MDLEPIAKSALEAAQPGLLAAFGAAAKHMYGLLRKPGQKFSWFATTANLFIAFFVGKMVGIFLDPYLALMDDTWLRTWLVGSRDGILMLCGVTALSLFGMAERAAEGVFGRWISSTTGQQVEDPKSGNPQPRGDE